MGLLEPMRAICTSFPGVTEKVSHGATGWFVKAMFVQLHEQGHHQNTFPHLWCAAPPGAQEELIASFPSLFFRPPYVGHRGWIGVRLDEPVDWEGIARTCEDAYRVVAPAKRLAELDARTA